MKDGTYLHLDDNDGADIDATITMGATGRVAFAVRLIDSGTGNAVVSDVIRLDTTEEEQVSVHF